MRKKVLVCNESAGSFSKYICNLLPKSCRIETLEGREHVVVPMVILTEGVHNGSNGPLYYPKEELGKTPESWNHKPIVVYHPTQNGVGISACDPNVINTRKVGIMMNTKIDGGRLVSEAWIERARADAVDSRIMSAIDKQEMMELSTGVFVDQEKQTGTWNGEQYVGVAKNFRPDHLALLPDQIGACSINDGAGFLRNSRHEKAGNSIISTVRQLLRSVRGLTTNEMSFSNIRETLSDALRARFTPKSGSDLSGPYLWVEDVYSNFVIYEFDSKLYRIGYTATDTGVTLSEDAPVEVVRVTEYRTASGTFVGNREPSQPQNTMNKTDLINKILTNSKVWKEADRAVLMNMSDEQLQAISASLPAAAATAGPVGAVGTPGPVGLAGSAAAPATNANPATAAAPATAQAPVVDNKVVSLVDYINAAPPEMREVLRNGVAANANMREQAIVAITANSEFTREELVSKPLGELQKLANVLAPKNSPAVHNYAGQAPVPSGTSAEKQTPLSRPKLEFGK